MLLETFSLFFFFTLASSRGARAPKNGALSPPPTRYQGGNHFKPLNAKKLMVLGTFKGQMPKNRMKYKKKLSGISGISNSLDMGHTKITINCLILKLHMQVLFFEKKNMF